MKIFSKLTASKVLIFVVVLAVLLVSEIIIIRQGISYEETIKVLMVKEDIKKGHKLKKDDLVIVEREINKVPRKALREGQENNLIGQSILTDIYTGEFLFSERFGNLESMYELREGYALVTISFEEFARANGFILEKNQEVDLIYTPDRTYDYNNGEEEVGTSDKYLESKQMKVIVKEILDLSLNKKGSQEYSKNSPRYITVMTKEEEAIFIVNSKDKGRFEIIVTPEKVPLH